MVATAKGQEKESFLLHLKERILLVATSEAKQSLDIILKLHRKTYIKSCYN